jgi:hypothetical protein
MEPGALKNTALWAGLWQSSSIAFFQPFQFFHPLLPALPHSRREFCFQWTSLFIMNEASEKFWAPASFSQGIFRQEQLHNICYIKAMGSKESI